MAEDRLWRWLKSTPNRTFVLYPLVVITTGAVGQRRSRGIDLQFSPLLAWGYLQYRLVGRYRVTRGGGGPGISTPPQRLLEDGPYRYTRNPMYLGHLIFLLGLTLTFKSRLAAALLAIHIAWFQQRVIEDEERLARQFGQPFEDYRSRVKRWIPGVY